MRRWFFPIVGLALLGCPGAPTPPADDLDNDGWPDATDTCVDVDGDGYGRPESDTSGCVVSTPDCDDTDSQTYPDAPEVCDARDNDCDGDADEGLDADGDGYTSCGADGVPGSADDDCNDASAEVYPGAPELCDGMDDDCDGEVPADEEDGDGDGFPSCAEDCDDGDADFYPGAPELCDGLDNDCDGEVPADEEDGDGDGFQACADDCDDGDAAFYPGAVELCDGQDNDCDGAVPADEQDVDGDGISGCDGDCDDGDASLFPGADEGCDGLDTDCDGTVPADEQDADGDGVAVCAGDCDDGDAATYPGANEACDGLDNDCDGQLPGTEADGDGDGAMVCDGDCDDADPLRFPGAAEVCDGVDNDCDQQIPADEEDGDGDGTSSCEGDCDDTDPSIHPGAEELCNGVDDDCDLAVDDAVDADGDGDDACVDCDDGDPAANHGDADGDGESSCDGDCDDGDPTVYSGAPQACDGIADNDCDGVTDPNEEDGDGDGLSGCGGDCDDGDGDVYPGATETECDGIDQDCDGVDQLPESVSFGLYAADSFVGGEQAGAASGIAVALAGDVNGDGFGDILIAAQSHDGLYSHSGKAYLVYGPVDTPESLSTADATFEGESESAYLNEVAAAGDVNGDGFDDILLGAGDEDVGANQSGKAYVVLGPPDPVMSPVASYHGEGASHVAGSSVAGVGDVDADGFDDILIGANGYSGNTGRAYLVYGPMSGDDSLASADARLTGEWGGDRAGIDVAGAGDVNGDGYDDMLVGAYGASHLGVNAGKAYLVLGPLDHDLPLGSADAMFFGEVDGDNAGYSVAGAGDVDGDGNDDVLIGAYANDEVGNLAGKAYLLRGPLSGWIGLDTADAEFRGEDAEDQSGRRLAGAGDVNGDGYDDLLIGAPGSDGAGANSGRAYLLLGPQAGTVDLDDASALITGEYAGDSAGTAVGGGADVDGDGLDDIVIGASGFDLVGSGSGITYLLTGPVVCN